MSNIVPAQNISLEISYKKSLSTGNTCKIPLIYIIFKFTSHNFIGMIQFYRIRPQNIP